MCASCVDPTDFKPDITVIAPDLQPKQAAHARARGGRYIFGDSPNNPNVQDAFRSNPAPRSQMVVSAEVWERIFGAKNGDSSDSPH